MPIPGVSWNQKQTSKTKRIQVDNWVCLEKENAEEGDFLPQHSYILSVTQI
jgi:hypothetical protein